MAFKKSNQHRRLITECLNFNAFKVFLNLPKEDNTKQLINAFVGYNCPAEQEALVKWYIARFRHIKVLNEFNKVKLRKKIKKLKDKGHRVNYSIEGKCTAYSMRLNLLDYKFCNFIAKHHIGQFATKYDNIKAFVAQYNCDQHHHNELCNRVIEAIKKNPMHFFKIWKEYSFKRCVQQPPRNEYYYEDGEGFYQLKQP